MMNTELFTRSLAGADLASPESRFHAILSRGWPGGFHEKACFVKGRRGGPVPRALRLPLLRRFHPPSD